MIREWKWGDRVICHEDGEKRQRGRIIAQTLTGVTPRMYRVALDSGKQQVYFEYELFPEDETGEEAS